jgi:hypothetical protein
MAERTRSKDQAGKRAEEAFKSAERRDTTSKQITETEHATAAAKTKKLRALRLAKEAADASDAHQTDTSGQPVVANRKRRR